MRYGYRLPVCGGWLRNVEDERTEASWNYVRHLAVRSEKLGFDLMLIAEVNLNNVKTADAPTVEAWSTAAALAAVTRRIELTVDVHPVFHQPALFAKAAASIDRISGGRLSLHIVSTWPADEVRRYGVSGVGRENRFRQIEEWLDVVDGLWHHDRFTFDGQYYRMTDAIIQPKPVAKPRPMVYGGAIEVGQGLRRGPLRRLRPRG